ncbi:MAG: type II toxin-antitoxin system VapC family toxin [Gemmatimonadaceae bacterium]
MILVDTSVWIDHLRRGNARLETLLQAALVSCHRFIVGELACGTLRNRSEILVLLGTLPSATVATHDETLAFLEANRLMGKGLGYVDVHLLAAAMLEGTPLWSLDRRLAAAAGRLGIAA